MNDAGLCFSWCEERENWLPTKAIRLGVSTMAQPNDSRRRTEP
jgi:hypothetical protein